MLAAALIAEAGSDAQVAWARMLISWQLELADKKLRPAGSPAHDTTLSHICPFPHHNPHCPAADVNGFLARHAPRPQPQVGLTLTPCLPGWQQPGNLQHSGVLAGSPRGCHPSGSHLLPRTGQASLCTVLSNVRVHGWQI